MKTVKTPLETRDTTRDTMGGTCGCFSFLVEDSGFAPRMTDGGMRFYRSYLSLAKLLERVMEKNTSGNSCGLSDSIQQILLSELFSKIIQDVNCYFPMEFAFVDDLPPGSSGFFDASYHRP